MNHKDHASPADRTPPTRDRTAHRLVRFWSDRRGNVAIGLALALIPIVLATGVAIDWARASSARSRLQAAIDAAVLAGATDASSTWTTLAKSTLTGTLAANPPTLTSSSFSTTTTGGYFGQAAGTIDTTIPRLFGIKTITVTAQATAMSKAGDPVCILLLSTTASPGLLMNSGASITAPTCQVHVKSTANPAATFNAGSTLNTKKTCIAGANTLDNGGSHPNVAKSCTTVSDPFAGKLPTPSSAACTYSNQNYNGGNVALSPGVYCGWTNFNSGPTVTLSPGVYVIKNGGFNVNGGSFAGTDVTIYFADSSYVQINGTVALNLKAPTSGNYANILMYEASGLSTSSFTMNATSGATLQGLIWLPSRNLTLNSGANAITNKTTMVLNSLIVDTAAWTMSTSDRTISAGGGGGGIYLQK